MKTTIFKRSLLIVCCLIGLQAMAQSSKTSYFMEGSPYRHLLNPAMSPQNGYLGLPALSNLQVGISSNLAATNFLFLPQDDPNGKLLTFLHPDVSPDMFLNSLADNNKLDFDLRTDLLSFGFYAGRSFISFDVALRANTGLNIPKDFFAFLKKGMSDGSGNVYDIRNFNIHANVYAEAALGVSTDIFENLRVGVKVKGLAGAAAIDANIDQMKIEMSPDEWAITTKATLSGYGKGLMLKDSAGVIQGVDFDKDNVGVGGKGLAFDFGAVYSPFKNLSVSFGVTDLGGLLWDKESISQAASQGTSSFAGLENLSLDGESSVEDQLSSITDGMMDMINFRKNTPTEGYYQKLNTKLNIGLEYAVLNNKISAGLLYSEQFTRFGNFSEWLCSVNLRPLRILQVSGSYSFISNYGKSYGLALSLFNTIYLAADMSLINFTPQYIPLDPLNASVQLGMNVPLGKKSKKSPRMDLSLW